MMTAYTDKKGYKWHPYSVEFESPEGKFSFEIYAVSFEHAELQVQAIRDTAKLSGRLESVK